MLGTVRRKQYASTEDDSHIVQAVQQLCKRGRARRVNEPATEDLVAMDIAVQIFAFDNALHGLRKQFDQVIPALGRRVAGRKSRTEALVDLTHVKQGYDLSQLTLTHDDTAVRLAFDETEMDECFKRLACRKTRNAKIVCDLPLPQTRPGRNGVRGDA